MKLSPGTYRLTQLVKNPDADRRVKYDWRQWDRYSADMVFVVESPLWRSLQQNDQVLMLLDSGIPENKIPESYLTPPLRMHPVGQSKDIGPSDKLWDVLTPHLVPCEENDLAFFDRLGIDRSQNIKFYSYIVKIMGRAWFEMTYNNYIEETDE